MFLNKLLYPSEKMWVKLVRLCVERVIPESLAIPVKGKLITRRHQ